MHLAICTILLAGVCSVCSAENSFLFFSFFFFGHRLGWASLIAGLETNTKLSDWGSRVGYIPYFVTILVFIHILWESCKTIWDGCGERGSKMAIE